LKISFFSNIITRKHCIWLFSEIKRCGSSSGGA
jgi:hypothetical protein